MNQKVKIAREGRSICECARLTRKKLLSRHFPLENNIRVRNDLVRKEKKMQRVRDRNGLAVAIIVTLTPLGRRFGIFSQSARWP